MAPATFTSKWADWTPKTPSQRTDSTDSFGDEGVKKAENRGFGENANKAELLPETPSQRTDTPDSIQTVSTVSSVNRRLEAKEVPPARLHSNDIPERFEERAAIAEFDGGLSRTEAEILAWDEVLTCVQCHHDTEGEADAARVSGGGRLHHERCYDRYFKFRQ